MACAASTNDAGFSVRGGQRVSRHYYDLHCLVHSNIGETALADREIGGGCLRLARMFFDRRDYDLGSAIPGPFAVATTGTMIDPLGRDYANMTAMIFGEAPMFEDILESVDRVERIINSEEYQKRTGST